MNSCLLHLPCLLAYAPFLSSPSHAPFKKSSFRILEVLLITGVKKGWKTKVEKNLGIIKTTTRPCAWTLATRVGFWMNLSNLEHQSSTQHDHVHGHRLVELVTALFPFFFLRPIMLDTSMSLNTSRSCWLLPPTFYHFFIYVLAWLLYTCVGYL